VGAVASSTSTTITDFSTAPSAVTSSTSTTTSSSAGLLRPYYPEPLRLLQLFLLLVLL
jgi:hypothetical protein